MLWSVNPKLILACAYKSKGVVSHEALRPSVKADLSLSVGADEVLCRLPHDICEVLCVLTGAHT